jgi:hypothetical protein
MMNASGPASCHTRASATRIHRSLGSPWEGLEGLEALQPSRARGGGVYCVGVREQPEQHSPVGLGLGLGQQRRYFPTGNCC